MYGPPLNPNPGSNLCAYLGKTLNYYAPVTRNKIQLTFLELVNITNSQSKQRTEFKPRQDLKMKFDMFVKGNC